MDGNNRVLFLVTVTTPSKDDLPPFTNVIGHTDDVEKARIAVSVYRERVYDDLSKKFQSVSVSNGSDGDLIFSCTDTDGKERKFLLGIDESLPLGYSEAIPGI